MKIFILLSTLLILNAGWASEFRSCEGEALFPELASSLCITVNAPLTYQDNNVDNIELFVRKFPSLETRQGSIWLIAGGPGESGASFYPIIDVYRKSFPNFDVFIPDHRGTGASSTICPEEAFNSAGGKSLVGKEWGTCFSHMYSNTSRVLAFNITNAAKDLKSLINNMSGTGKRYVYGVSYGTQLTSRLLQLDDISIDGVILDSLVPMQDDMDYGLSKRSIIVNMVGNALLERCRGSLECSEKDANKLKLKLSTLVKNNRLISDLSEELPSIPLSNLLGSMLDVPHVRNKIPGIIRSLSKGDTASLVNAYSELEVYYSKFEQGYVNAGNSIPLVQVITSSENNLRPKMTKADVELESNNLIFTSALPKLFAENRMPTYKKDKYFAQLPTEVPRIIVLHGTMDPKTHYNAAVKHAEKLARVGDVTFIDITDAPHFIAFNAPSCFKTYVDKFIKGGVINQLTCKDENVLINF
jgi:pimeloyl-ACP methyl ester carboxylesterase